jgi:hypothetical protein
VKQSKKALSVGSSDLGSMARMEMSTTINEANKAYTAWTSVQLDWLGFLTNVQKISKGDLDIKKVKRDDSLH